MAGIEINNILGCFQVNEWNEIRLISDALSTGYLFRGQQEETWALCASLERACKNLRYDIAVKQMEEHLVQTFKRAAHMYLSYLPDDNNWLEWMALIQHYGGPTRLLDFTRSIYVASFFALDTPSTGNNVIWAINLKYLQQKINEFLQSLGFTVSAVTNELNGAKVFNQLYNTEIVGCGVGYGTPFKQNERISIQQGNFLFSLNLENSFEKNLFGMMGFSLGDVQEYLQSVKPLEDFSDENVLYNIKRKKVLKIILNKQVRKTGLLDLERMNINHASLFPGLDGYAKSLKHQILIHSDE